MEMARKSPWRLEDKRILITGATRGIGAAIAREMLSLGASVLLTARDPERVRQCVEEHRGEGYLAYGLAADVAHWQGRQQIIEWIDRQWGGLEVLVNNAGTNIRQQTLAYRSADYHRLMQTNLESAWELSRLAFAHLKKAETGGSIINISSVAAVTAITTSTAAYAMSKAGMDQMTRFLAAEWGPHNIRVNSIQPWYIRTPLAEQVLQDDQKRRSILERTPMNRVGEPREVACTAAFLAMSASSYISGACIPVDGAFLCKGI